MNVILYISIFNSNISLIICFVQGTVLRRLHGGFHNDVVVCDGLLYTLFDENDNDDDGASVIHVYSIQTWQRTSVIDIPCAAQSHWHTLCVNPKGMFIACYDTDSVIKMSLDGKKITIHGDQQSEGMCYFNGPFACMSDIDGNGLIADDFNDRLQLLHGEQRSVLQLEPAPIRPCRAVYDGSALFVATGYPFSIAKYEEIE